MKFVPLVIPIGSSDSSRRGRFRRSRRSKPEGIDLDGWKRPVVEEFELLGIKFDRLDHHLVFLGSSLCPVYLRNRNEKARIGLDILVDVSR